MNEHGADDHQRLHDHNHQGEDVETMLESRISHVLHNQAKQIHLTPKLHSNVMQRISSRSKRPFVFAPTFIAVIAAIILLSLTTYLLYPFLSPHATRTASIQYVVTTSLNTPDELAHGGELVSLDPTQQHFVYQSGPGVMYTADVSNPATSNVLAMRYARDAVWSPDGSALVTTIYPVGVITPLLALVHTGQYMDTLGHEALAASWSPTTKQEIVFVTQQNGVTQLWSTTPSKGQTPTLLATISLPPSSLVQHLLWSPDGQTLALVTTQSEKPSPQSLAQAGNAIFVMNMKTNDVHQLALGKNAAIGTTQWSPNGHFLTYEQLGTQDSVTLRTIDMTKQQVAFTIAPQHMLLGWSWSPDSNALVYSDNGILSAHVLHGAHLVFPKTNATYPLWLHDGRILAVNKTNGSGKLEVLSRTATK